MRSQLVVAYRLMASVWVSGAGGFSVAERVRGARVPPLHLVGVPFTAISFLTMNEVRRIRTSHNARYVGLLTAMFAIGQIMEPPAIGAILRHNDTFVQ
ncbi:hypothetical protein ASE04_06535 [Rhizobium sp. Root708]|nr:hypothetical protein ASE04_06535 [Rhizobium sp. Root708]